MHFEFDNYILRQPRSEDAQGFFEISQDKEAMKYYGVSGASFANVADAQGQVEWCISQFSKNAGRWIITEKNQDQYIGDIGFYDYIDSHKRVELGYRLSRKYWGKGIVTNFIKLLVPWGISDLGYNRIEAMVDARNIGSKIVLKKNKFQFEGTLRDYEFEHGHFVDLEMYSMLKRDFLHD
jgi:ribosomal-protein-alanine N-acetyltransferase